MSIKVLLRALEYEHLRSYEMDINYIKALRCYRIRAFRALFHSYSVLLKH